MRKPNPQTEYRLRRTKRVENSPTLEEKFPRVKKVAVTLEYLDAAGLTRTGGMNYKLNVAHAKSILFFNCIHSDCVGGDFDLTQELAQAIAAKRNCVSGEMCCQGTRRNQDRKITTPCQSILRYKLTLAY